MCTKNCKCKGKCGSGNKKIKVYQYHFHLGMIGDFIAWGKDEEDAKKTAIIAHKYIIKMIQKNRFEINKVKDVKPIEE
jgi:hypothetical protein